MLASELAAELQVDAGVMSRRLALYFTEAKQERKRYLSEQTVSVVRQAHRLYEDGDAKSFKTALQMVIGTYSEPVPPESARLIEQRLSQLEDMQEQTLQKVDRVLRYLETAMGQSVEDGGFRTTP